MSEIEFNAIWEVLLAIYLHITGSEGVARVIFMIGIITFMFS